MSTSTITRPPPRFSSLDPRDVNEAVKFVITPSESVAIGGQSSSLLSRVWTPLYQIAYIDTSGEESYGTVGNLSLWKGNIEERILWRAGRTHFNSSSTLTGVERYR